MTRARSASLVGLLLALACALPAAAQGAPSASDVRKALRSGDRGQTVAMLQALSGQLDRQTLKAVLDDAVRLKPLGVYDELLATLRTAADKALDELLKGATRERDLDLRFLIVDALGRHPDPQAEATLLEVAEEDRDERVAVLAIRGLGKRGTPTAVDGLIALLAELEKDLRKSRLAREAGGALATLTGQDGLTVAQDWQNYWTAHRASFTAPAPAADGATQTRDESALDRMRRERPADVRTMERLRDDEILVIRGSSDRVEEVLRGLKLPHQVHERDALEALTLDPARQVLVLNCAGKEQMSDQGIAKIREFVARGGYLFTSDWELRNVLARAFPEVVAFLGETPNQDQKATIRPHPEAASHPLLRDVFPLSTWTDQSFSWNLDRRSHMVRPNPQLVPLVISPEMEAHGSSTLGFTFSFTAAGGGRPVTGAVSDRVPIGQVLHVSSHFKNQRDASGDGFALQQLLLNFVVEKQELRKALARNR